MNNNGSRAGQATALSWTSLILPDGYHKFAVR